MSEGVQVDRPGRGFIQGQYHSVTFCSVAEPCSSALSSDEMRQGSGL